MLHERPDGMSHGAMAWVCAAVTIVVIVGALAGCEGSCEDKLNCGPQVVATGGSSSSSVGGGGVGGAGGGGQGGGGDATGGGGARPLGVADITAGTGHTCAVLTDGSGWCWGVNTFGQLGNGAASDFFEPQPVSGLSDLAQISAGPTGHTCAVTGAGAVHCWGFNDRGQLGDGSQIDKSVPSTAVPLGEPATGVVAGGQHSCAILADQSVWCWGYGMFGQLGNGANLDSATPVQVQGVSTAQELALGTAHSCARLSDGSVSCWGQNFFGQLGSPGGSSSTPQEIGGFFVAGALGAGDEHMCAVASNQSVACWGRGEHLQLGNGNTSNLDMPAAVSTVDMAIAVAAGESHSCAATTDAVLCWGSGGNGQLGHGATTNSAAPVAVDGLGGVQALAAGGHHTCAILDEQTARCWGQGVALGHGTDQDSVVPVEPLLPLGRP